MAEKEELSTLNEDGSLEISTKPHTSVNDETTAESNYHTFTNDKDSVDAEGGDETSSCINKTSQQLTFVEVLEDETHPKGSLNESNSALDATARQFRNGFFELVEELKLRRTLDNENEKQIKTLFSEKSHIHQKWEEEISKSDVQKNVHEKEMKGITKKFEERLHQHEIDKAKDDIAVQCNMREMNHLKDEIRALHLAKYSIEKRANELDREQHIQATAREHHVKQLTEMEKKYHDAISQTHEAFDLVNKVEINVGAAVRLHKKICYYNEHQKCQLNSYKQGLECKQHELACLKILVENLKASLRTAEDNGFISEQNEMELKMQAEVCRHLQSQLNEARKENKNLIDSLKEAHNLVDRHVGIANKHCELESLAQFELDEANSECENLKKEMGELRKSHVTMQLETAEKFRAWNKEKREKDKELVDIKSRYEALTHAHNTLEDNNCKLDQHIEELKKEMEKLICSEKEKSQALADSSLQTEKMKEDYRNQVLELQKQIAKTRNQVLEESNSVKYWKEKFAAIERKAEDLQVNLTEITNKIKHNEVNPHSQVTQTDEYSHVQEKEENTDNIESATNKDELKAELLKRDISPGVTANTTDGIENVNLPTPSAESIVNRSSNAHTTEAIRIAFDDLVGEVEGVISSGSYPVQANDSVTAVADNENTEHITKSTKIGVSTEDVSCEMEKTNQPFLTTSSLSESFVKDNKEQTSVETRKDIIDKCSMTVPTSVVPNTHTLKSCLRDKSLNQGISPRVYKKLQFNLPTSESLANVLLSLDKDELESDKNESLLQERNLKPKMGCPGVPNSTSIHQTVDHMREDANKEEQKSFLGEIEALTKPKLTHMMPSSNDRGASLSKSCDEHIKDKSDGSSGKNKCNMNGNSDVQELFSDDEDEGQTVMKCHEVGQQIKQIQQFLNNESLTTNRKRKFPGISIDNENLS